MNVENIINKIIDKSKWQTFRFDELANNIVEKVVPKNSGLEHYIGLEHLDTSSLHIKRYGETKNLIGDKLKIYKGDIIFAKRNAYLKRVAISQIDGIASAHSLVLRINEKNVDKHFFPFFLMSEYFWERAIEISVGSLSPTINWKSLAKQEFLLPPKDQQAELADLLWAMDDMIEKDLVVLKKVELFKSSKLEYILFDSNNPKVTLKNYIYEKKNISIPPHKIEKYIGLEHLISGRNEINGYDSSSNVLSNCFKIEEGDLCYSKLRPYLDKAVIADFECVATTELIILDTVQLSKRTILEILHSARFLAYIKDKGYGTKMPRVNFNIIGEFDFNLPKDIDSVEKIIINFDNAMNLLREKLQSSKVLQKSLINQIF